MLACERRGIGEVANDTLTARQQPAHWSRITDAQAEPSAVALGGWEGPTDLGDALRACGVLVILQRRVASSMRVVGSMVRRDRVRLLPRELPNPPGRGSRAAYPVAGWNTQTGARPLPAALTRGDLSRRLERSISRQCILSNAISARDEQ